MRKSHKILVGKPEAIRRYSGTWGRWEDKIKMDLQSVIEYGLDPILGSCKHRKQLSDYRKGRKLHVYLSDHQFLEKDYTFIITPQHFAESCFYF